MLIYFFFHVISYDNQYSNRCDYPILNEFRAGVSKHFYKRVKFDDVKAPVGQHSLSTFLRVSIVRAFRLGFEAEALLCDAFAHIFALATSKHNRKCPISINRGCYDVKA